MIAAVYVRKSSDQSGVSDERIYEQLAQVIVFRIEAAEHA